jgi:hypothetical protein
MRQMPSEVGDGQTLLWNVFLTRFHPCRSHWTLPDVGDEREDEQKQRYSIPTIEKRHVYFAARALMSNH